MLNATQRRASISRQLAKFGFDYTIIDGVIADNSQKSNKGYDNSKRVFRYGYSLSQGEIGCFLAHQFAWRAVTNETSKCLILEDDVIISDINMSLFEQLQATRYPIVRLAGTFKKRHKFIGATNFAKYWGDPAGATAYVLGPQQAKILLSKSSRFFMPVDDFLEARYIHGLNTYALLPYPIWQMGTDTHIGDRTRPKLSVLDRLRIMLIRIPIDINKYYRRLLYYFFY